MLKKLFYFYLFYLINSLKINNITHEYSEGVFKNAILKKGAEYFFANTADNLYKSSTLDGSKINSFSLNFSDNSSFIYVSELDIFIAACTKDFLLAIIDSSSKIHIIFKENIIKNYSPVQELIAENKCNLLYYFSNEDGEENFNLIFSIPRKEDEKFTSSICMHCFMSNCEFILVKVFSNDDFKIKINKIFYLFIYLFSLN